MCNRVAIVGLLTVTLALILSANGYGSTPTCTLYASPAGSDAASGSLGSPFLTVQHLVDSLPPGGVGCLREGSYREGVEPSAPTNQVKITTPGITLTAAPGERAEIDGRLVVAQGADGVTVENLYLEGANPQGSASPTVDAARTTFRHVDVTNAHTAICFALGNYGYETASDTVIEDSRIHDCGRSSTNQQHGIYVSSATGTMIRGNWIYDNADRGIQLYPNAQETTITANVIYGNGEGIIFSGRGSITADGTTVVGNVIAGAKLRQNVESYYEPGAAVGVENVVRRNCVYGAATPFYAGWEGSGLQQPEVGFNAAENVVSQPQFVAPAQEDFRLIAGSRCATLNSTPSYEELPGVPGTLPASPQTEYTPTTGSEAASPAPSPHPDTGSDNPSSSQQPSAGAASGAGELKYLADAVVAKPRHKAHRAKRQGHRKQRRGRGQTRSRSGKAA
jgi:parallel beta-helix repeat protein